MIFGELIGSAVFSTGAGGVDFPALRGPCAHFPSLPVFEGAEPPRSRSIQGMEISSTRTSDAVPPLLAVLPGHYSLSRQLQKSFCSAVSRLSVNIVRSSA